MKAKILLTILTIGMITGAYAQKATITLTFTGNYNGQHVPLNSILIENLTKGADTTLYEPDTILMLDYVTGIYEDNIIGGHAFSVSQNYPNPFKNKTTLDLYLHENDNVLITVSDIMGRECIYREYRLERGNQSFTFYPGMESLYFLTARIGFQSQTIKMFNSPSLASISEICKLEYGGNTGIRKGYKASSTLNNFVFNLGDQLKFTAYAALGDQTIIDTPSGNQTYIFQFDRVGIPCPGMPTVTDIDGNVYNTVQIGTQCWMAENLKTTTYGNGTAIPNVTENTAWTNLASGAYVWYDNDSSLKDKYGALYNWFATVDSNELCPAGWHVPTNNEWTVLTDYIGGTSSPHGNELKSCRQSNSPLGGDCITSEHPRWNEDITHYGTDDYGFSGFPGGIRFYFGNFNYLGDYGRWWSSTEYSSASAWLRTMYYNNGYIYEHYTNKRYGFSVRCLRD